MLNCTVCGHDNFPFTNSQISGWASGQSLQMVSRCHQCGARVAEECKVCRRLHPLNTTHCSMNGVRIQDFLNLKTDIQTRAEVFRGLPEAQEAMAEMARYAYKIKRVFIASILALLGGFTAIALLPIMGMISFITGMTLLIVSVCWMVRVDSRISNRMMALWKNVNSGVLEPVYISVWSKRININFKSENTYCPMSLEDRLLNQILDQHE